MIGGIVIGITRRDEGDIGALVTVDSGPHERSHETCSIRVRENRWDNGVPIRVNLGDAIWWQGDSAYWSPKGTPRGGKYKCGKHWDIRLPKIGYSH